jgi:hypothetical protein
MKQRATAAIEYEKQRASQELSIAVDRELGDKKHRTVMSDWRNVTDTVIQIERQLELI